jgi:predicted nucleic-acid-binding Zn-ribbon protein
VGLFSKSGNKGKEPARYMAAGAEITCPQCQNNVFLERKAQLNTAAMSLLDLDWANKSATTLICYQCSFICWFHDEPQRTDQPY